MDSFCLSSFEFFWQALKDYFISARVTFQPFKVVDSGANRKGVCDFLLVRHSNFGPILHRFGDCEIGCVVFLVHPVARQPGGASIQVRCLM